MTTRASDRDAMTTVGILGGGQLARMLALSGAPLGLRFLVLDNSADACAGQFVPMLVGDYRDEAALAEFASRSRRRHLRFRERARRIGAVAGASACRCSRTRARSPWRRTGSPRKPCSANWASACRLSPTIDTRADLDAALADARRAVHPQDAPPGLRRQGPVPDQDARRCRRGLGRARRAGPHGRPDPRGFRAVRA